MSRRSCRRATRLSSTLLLRHAATPPDDRRRAGKTGVQNDSCFCVPSTAPTAASHAILFTARIPPCSSTSPVSQLLLQKQADALFARQHGQEFLAEATWKLNRSFNFLISGL